MNDFCCSSMCKPSQATKHKCPVNKKLYSSISTRTVTHHVCKSWELKTDGKDYYFCDDPECDVVYFSDDDSIITKSQLRNQVGIKTNSSNSMLCYCYGITKADFAENPSIKDFVIQQTKAGLCSCETSNPSGRCCLKEFPK